MRPGRTSIFEEMLKWLRTVDTTVTDLTRQIFELQTFCTTDERVTTRPTRR